MKKLLLGLAIPLSAMASTQQTLETYLDELTDQGINYGQVDLCVEECTSYESPLMYTEAKKTSTSDAADIATAIVKKLSASGKVSVRIRLKTNADGSTSTDIQIDAGASVGGARPGYGTDGKQKHHF